VFSRVVAMVRKEFIHILRDPGTLAMVFLVPAIELVLFGYAINTTVDHLPTVVLDQADDRLSRAFVQSLVNSTMFDLAGYVTDVQSVRAAIDDGRAKVGVIIPPTYAQDLEAGRTAEVQVLIDGSDPTVAQSALYAIESLGQAESGAALANRLAARGLALPGTAIDVRPIVLYNPSMLSINFMIPGLIGLIMQLQTIMLTAFAIVREREQGTFEQLIVTPIRPVEIMIGKLLPYVFIAFVNVGIILAVGIFWFKATFAGDLGLLLALAGLFLFSTLGLGLLISTISRTQLQATQLSIFVMLPSMLLTGFVFPRDTMPWPLYDLGFLVPLTFFLRILRGVMLKGVGLDVLWVDVLPMTVLGLSLFLLSASRFRKQLV